MGRTVDARPQNPNPSSAAARDRVAARQAEHTALAGNNRWLARRPRQPRPIRIWQGERESVAKLVSMSPGGGSEKLTWTAMVAPTEADSAV